MAGERMDAGGSGGLSRRSVWALLAVLVAVALIAVVAVGAYRAGRVSDPAPSPTPTLTVRPPSAPPPIPISTSSPTTVAGTAGSVTVRTLSSVPLTLPDGYDLVGVANRALVRLQPQTRRLITTGLNPLAVGDESGPSVAVAPAAGWVAVASDFTETVQVVVDDHRAQLSSTQELFGLRLVGPGPDSDHVWAINDTTGPQPLIVLDRQLRTTLRGPAMPAVRGAGYSLGSATPDDGGAVLVAGVGGTYRVTTEAVTRVTTGRVLAAGPTGWLAQECDDHAICSMVLIDRNTAARRTVDLDRDDQTLQAGALSPDGRWLAAHSGSGDLTVTDLTTGVRMVRSLPMSQPGYGASIPVWTPGNIVVAPGADGQVIIVDPAARETRTMSLGVPVVVLAIRATG